MNIDRHQFIEKLETAFERDDFVERVQLVVFVTKAVLFSIAFFIFVILWDTLPSVSPLSKVDVEIDLKKEYGSQVLKIVESYRVTKLVDFEIRRSIVNMDSGVSIKLPHTKGLYQLGPKTETLTAPLDVKPGRWCLISSVVWINGLSLIDHSSELPVKCFEVK